MKGAQMLSFITLQGDDSWREKALKVAAKRHGKPFKCAAPTLPREILVDRVNRVYKAVNHGKRGYV